MRLECAIAECLVGTLNGLLMECARAVYIPAPAWAPLRGIRRPLGPPESSEGISAIVALVERGFSSIHLLLVITTEDDDGLVVSARRVGATFRFEDAVEHDGGDGCLHSVAGDVGQGEG